MNAFWIFGIVLNVTLTALGIWWVVKQMRRRDGKKDEGKPGSHAGHSAPGSPGRASASHADCKLN